jgi:hypothetical protein
MHSRHGAYGQRAPMGRGMAGRGGPGVGGMTRTVGAVALVVRGDWDGAAGLTAPSAPDMLKFVLN